jgi:hypothetical protein
MPIVFPHILYRHYVLVSLPYKPFKGIKQGFVEVIMQVRLSYLILEVVRLSAALRKALRKLVAIVKPFNVYFSICLYKTKARRELFPYELLYLLLVVVYLLRLISATCASNPDRLVRYGLDWYV